ncbi:hypothetical protein OG828_42295 [Streptomyces sp. NBC_00457]|nr:MULTISPECIES: hypothetical protein [unclassified Streptomyces]
MGQLSEHLRQAAPVVAERGEGVHLFGRVGIDGFPEYEYLAIPVADARG